MNEKCGMKSRLVIILTKNFILNEDNLSIQFQKLGKSTQRKSK